MRTMEELVALLNEASKAYYSGTEIMTNLEFDQLVDELKAMEAAEGRVLPGSPTKNVGSEAADGLPKYKHPFPALSLDKTKDITVIKNAFARGIAESGSDNDRVCVMYKEDGSTVQAYYNGGKLDKLVTRGNGEIGSVITHNAKCIAGLPLEIPFKGYLVVRGEALMSYEEFERINQTLPAEAQYKNPRNLAAATLTILDPNEAAKRRLNLKAFNLVYIDSDDVLFESFSYRLDYLDALGFDTVDRITVRMSGVGIDDPVEELTANVSSYAYPVDGLVLAVDNWEYSHKLAGTEHHPHVLNGYAFKWADHEEQTIIREIEWSPSRTGLLNPVAIFDPVELEGTTVKRASLHNLSIMRKMRIHVGDSISVYKSNMIIPYISKNLSYEQEKDYDDDFVQDLIGFCPTCGAAAEVRTSKDGIETVYCPNEECPEKMIGKFANFCSRDGLDIQGMSEETIKKLVHNKFIQTYSDFFRLDSKPGISFLPGFGKQSWTKMCTAAEKARTTDFVHFFTAMSIPNIGKGQLKTLRNYLVDNYEALANKCGADPNGFNLGIMLSMLGQSGFDFALIDGFGSILADDLSTWLRNHFNVKAATMSPELNVYGYMTFTDAPKVAQAESASQVLAGKNVCITGKLIHFSNRQELVDKIEANGGKWVDSVSSKTHFLINNDVESTSGKNKKALELAIPIISEEDFLKLIGG